MAKSDIGLNQRSFINRINNYEPTKIYRQRIVIDSDGETYSVVSPNPQERIDKLGGIDSLLSRLEISGEKGLSHTIKERINTRNKPNLETFENNYRILQAYFGKKDVIGEIKKVLESKYNAGVTREDSHITLLGLSTIAPETLLLNLWQHENAGRDKYDLNLSSLRKLPKNAEKHIFYN